MSITNPDDSPTVIDSRVDVENYLQASPILGLIPRTAAGRFFMLWAVLNVVLTLLPVFTSVGNAENVVAGFLPLTVLWSYTVFTSNILMGLAYYIRHARPWALAYESQSGVPFKGSFEERGSH